MPNLLKFGIAISIPLFIGFIGSIFTRTSVSDWYLTLNKPSFNPPALVFSPVWTALFFLMGISFYLIWKRGIYKKAFTFFGVQLALNLLWSVLFFGLKNPGLALIEIVFLWIAILATALEFKKISRNAFYLMLPYLAWVTFAAVLNYFILVLN